MELSNGTLGVVVIGRNEGQRLVDCLSSLSRYPVNVVYVDSGSTDDSVARATETGATVVDLDMRVPFTAARARNAGLTRLLELVPVTEFVQFVDGDCVLDPHWLAVGVAALRADGSLAVVCGRVRERFPERSVFNRLCDLEWNTPIGEAEACGGNALMRVVALHQVGGFRDDLIAGEEPELCARLRRCGWKISRLDAEMVTHDADMHRLRQWWRRSFRAGHAFAEAVSLHGGTPEAYWTKVAASGWLYAVAVPTAAAVIAPWTPLGALLTLGAYPWLFRKLYWHFRARGASHEDALAGAAFGVLEKFPQVGGQLSFAAHAVRGKKQPIIEHKESPTAA